MFMIIQANEYADISLANPTMYLICLILCYTSRYISHWTRWNPPINSCFFELSFSWSIGFWSCYSRLHHQDSPRSPFRWPHGKIRHFRVKVPLEASWFASPKWFCWSVSSACAHGCFDPRAGSRYATRRLEGEGLGQCLVTISRLIGEHNSNKYMVDDTYNIL